MAEGLKARDCGGAVAGGGRGVGGHGQTALPSRLPARQRALERAPELGGQRVVQNGVDGAETTHVHFIATCAVIISGITSRHLSYNNPGGRKVDDN